jgi:hypothetical protein
MTMTMALFIKIFQDPEMAFPDLDLIFQFGGDVAQNTDPMSMPVCIGVNVMVISMVSIQMTKLVLFRNLPSV